MSSKDNSISNNGVGFGNTVNPKFGGNNGNSQYPDYAAVKLPPPLPDSYAPSMPKGSDSTSNSQQQN
jgi:hypothetical protein